MISIGDLNSDNARRHRCVFGFSGGHEATVDLDREGSAGTLPHLSALIQQGGVLTITAPGGVTTHLDLRKINYVQVTPL